MTCTNNCGSCTCNERAALIAELERMGWVKAEDGEYKRDGYPSVAFDDPEWPEYAWLVTEHCREIMSYDESLDRLYPYRIRAAIAQHLRATINWLAVDGEEIGIDDVIAALEA